MGEECKRNSGRQKQTDRQTNSQAIRTDRQTRAVLRVSVLPARMYVTMVQVVTRLGQKKFRLTFAHFSISCGNNSLNCSHIDTKHKRDKTRLYQISLPRRSKANDTTQHNTTDDMCARITEEDDARTDLLSSHIGNAVS